MHHTYVMLKLPYSASPSFPGLDGSNLEDAVCASGFERIPPIPFFTTSPSAP